MTERMDAIGKAARDNLGTGHADRAPVLWFGGKGKLARKIVPLLPRGRVYVEPFMGAASVFFHLPRPRPVEVLNDIDGELVNLFRVLQCPDTFRSFCHRVTWTPYARAEFIRALQSPMDADPVTRAWAFFVRQNQGFGGKANTPGDWGRVFTVSGGMAEQTAKWRARLAMLPRWHDRLTRVQLDSRDALDVIAYWDTPDTVFYIDPPYVHDTRAGNIGVYAAEMSDANHAALVDAIRDAKGQCVVSGYAHPIYEPLETGPWRRVDFETTSHAAGRVRGSSIKDGNAPRRVETLWIKEHDNGRYPLFAGLGD